MAAQQHRARARAIVRDGYEIGPRLQPCSCGAPRHAHEGPKMSGAHPATGCRRYRRDVADALAERAMAAVASNVMDDIVAWHANAYPRPTPKPGGWGVGPSDSGTCQKQIQYRERPPADFTPNAVDESAATLGNIWHDIIRRARQYRYPHRKYEFELTIPGLDRTGRMDEYDPIAAIGTDYKSLSEFMWEYVGEHGPREEDWKQLAVYCKALRAQGHDVDIMQIIYIRRATGESEYHHRPYDETFAQAALAHLTGIALALDLGEDLPREGRGPTSDPICANWCPARDHCWNVAAATEAGRSPESYTILGEHPDAEQIEWAASLARDWKDAEKEASREYAATIPLLAGVESGTYGDFIVTEKTRRMPNYKEYYERVRKEYETYLMTPADQRGEFANWVANIPLPYRRDVWPEVRRVRAANRKSTKKDEVTAS